MSGDYNTHNEQQPNINYTDHTVDLSKYAVFVDGVTSDPSKDYQSFVESLDDLDGQGSNIHRLLTAAVGVSAEGGEFMEIVKKMVFQKFYIVIVLLETILVRSNFCFLFLKF